MNSCGPLCAEDRAGSARDLLQHVCSHYRCARKLESFAAHNTLAVKSRASSSWLEVVCPGLHVSWVLPGVRPRLRRGSSRSSVAACLSCSRCGPAHGRLCTLLSSTLPPSSTQLVGRYSVWPQSIFKLKKSARPAAGISRESTLCEVDEDTMNRAFRPGRVLAWPAPKHVNPRIEHGALDPSCELLAILALVLRAPARACVNFSLHSFRVNCAMYYSMGFAARLPFLVLLARVPLPLARLRALLLVLVGRLRKPRQ